MIRLLTLAAILTASVTSAAEPQQIILWKLDAGYYLIQGGQPVLFSPSGPVVPPDDPIVPPPTTEFSKAVTTAALLIPVSDKRHTAAMKLTATYQMLGGQVKDGKIHPANAVAAADMICPIALGVDGKAWQGVFSVVNAELAKAGDAAACASVFDAAATAVLSTVPAAADGDMQAAAQRYGFDWDVFMEFLMKLLVMLLPLIIS